MVPQFQALTATLSDWVVFRAHWFLSNQQTAGGFRDIYNINKRIRAVLLRDLEFKT